MDEQGKRLRHVGESAPWLAQANGRYGNDGWRERRRNSKREKERERERGREKERASERVATIGGRRTTCRSSTLGELLAMSHALSPNHDERRGMPGSPPDRPGASAEAFGTRCIRPFGGRVSKRYRAAWPRRWLRHASNGAVLAKKGSGARLEAARPARWMMLGTEG